MFRRDLIIDLNKNNLNLLKIDIQRGPGINLDWNQTSRYKTMHLQQL